MASNQPTKAIHVIPSDSINIPEPGSYTSGTNTGTGTTPSTKTAANVVSVDSNTKLTLSAPGLTGGAAYNIYRGVGGLRNTKSGNEGFSLFVGTGGDIKVLPASSENPVILKNISNNSYVPLQVVRVFNTDTTASDILALD